MEKQFDIILKNRTILHRILTQTSKEDLFKIPKGYRNNIWWNIAHVVVTQQLLVYRLSGQPVLVEEALIEKYRKGTIPEGEPSEAEMGKIAEYLLSTVDQMKADHDQEKFAGFDTYMTSPKVELKNANDAISFAVFHEGIHLGTILALQKAIKN